MCAAVENIVFVNHIVCGIEVIPALDMAVGTLIGALLAEAVAGVTHNIIADTNVRHMAISLRGRLSVEIFN